MTSFAACVFFTTIYFKEALQPAEWKAAEILLLGDFLQGRQGPAGNWFEFNIMQSTHCAKNPDKKLCSRTSHPGLVPGSRLRTERGPGV